MPVTIVTKGLIGLYRDGVLISDHTVESKGIESALRHAETHGNGDYELRYPNKVVSVSLLQKTVVPFSWANVAVEFTQGQAAAVDLALFLTNEQGYPIAYGVTGSLPAGTTLAGSVLSYDGVGAVASRTVYLVASSGSFVATSGAASVAVTAAPNLAPVWSGSTAISGLAGSSVPLAGLVADPEGQPLTFSLGAQSGGHSVSTAGVLTLGTASGSATVIARDSGGLTASRTFTVTVDLGALWFYGLYSAFVTAQGGAPIAESSVRYWSEPTYPTGGSLVAIGSTIEFPGTYYLADGAHTGSLTINADDVTLYAQTRHGATITGNITVNGNRCDVMGFKWAGTSTASPYCVDLVGSDNRVAFCLVPADFAPFDDSLRRHLFVCDGARSRVCYNTAISWRGGGHFAHISPDVKLYCRVDHNYISEWYCVDPTAPDNEFVQVGQAQYGVDYFALIDNNYLYRWNNQNNGPVQTGGSAADAETFTIKSDGNCIIANVFQGCHGTVNLRQAANCLVFGNFWLGDGMATAGGVGIYGQNHVIACNYFAGLNSGGSPNYPAFRVGSGDDLSTGYYAARNVEIAFNTTVNCRMPIVFSPRDGLLIAPTGTRFYNNAIDINTASNAVVVATGNPADVGTTWAGNVIEPTVGRTVTGITAAVPGLTPGSGVRYATPAGNCDGTAQPGYSSIINHDAVGAAIAGDIGSFQVAPAINPWQAIIDGAGA